MESLYLLIPLSVAAVFGIVVVLWWATTGGQFDDLESHGQRVVIDNDQPPPERCDADGKKLADRPPVDEIKS